MGKRAPKLRHGGAGQQRHGLFVDHSIAFYLREVSPRPGQLLQSVREVQGHQVCELGQAERHLSAILHLHPVGGTRVEVSIELLSR